MQSIRFISRGRTESQRGFVLVIALVLAILYFMLMALVMIDSSRAQAEAQRYRARVVSAALAENAAELACVQMVTTPSGMAQLEDSQGTMMGTYRRLGSDTSTQARFEVNGEAQTKGLLNQKATVFLEGHFDGNQIHIDFARHSQ
ncbi:MAG TPA: hypothetical protein VJ901_06840 [Thermoanaerobaculia bacterium]|nr:hypothetical protein [Thermoanaerobaculia bacterium]